MVTRDEMLELVRAHEALDEPMDCAIWIRRGDREAWLVELIPSLGADPNPERPVAFNPGLTFKHPLNLFASDLEGLQRAMKTDPALAREVAAGEILLGDAPGRELQALARELDGHNAAG